MNQISYRKMVESEYKDFGLYLGCKKIDLDNTFLFERINSKSLKIYSYLTSKNSVVNDQDGKGVFFDFILHGVEFKGVDSKGELLNIEGWVINNAMEINGASDFLEL